MAVSTQTEEELAAYHQAYLHIFRSILNKRGLDPARQKQILLKIQQFQQSKITDTDSYLDHIPSFASMLGVKPDQLGAFIGANLLKALHQVQAQMAQKKKVAAQATRLADDPAVKRSVLKEIALTLGSFVEAPTRFVIQDRGLMALSLDGSLELSATAKSEAPVGMAQENTDSSPNDSAASREVGLLNEIINSFGDVLGVTEKLVVPPFPKAMRAEMDKANISVESSSSDDENVGEGSLLAEIVSKFTDALTNVDKLIVPPFPKAMREQQELAQIGAEASDPADTGQTEPSLLAEIVLMLGDGGSVEKLNIQSGPISDPGAMALNQAASQAVEAIFEPLELSYGDYGTVMKKVQIFQARKDGPGYQEWINSEAAPAIIIILGLRKLDNQKQKGATINYPDEYYRLSQLHSVDSEQVKELHERSRVFARMQKLQILFISKVKQQPPQLLKAFQKIWPQVRLILNDDDSVEGRMSQLKIPMLQFTNPKLKAAISRMIEPLFKKMDEIKNF